MADSGTREPPDPDQRIEATDGATISDVIQAVVSGQVNGDLHIGDKIYTRSDLEELDDYLARAVAAYEARMYQLVARPPVPPDQPYKFLYAFEIEDADIFFGRDAASKALHQTVLKDRLTVLHAKSGAGKTSILNAGLSPRLIREGRLLVYARAYDDPVRAIKRTIAPPSLGPWPELLPPLTLHEFLGLACAHLSRQTQEVVIVLDQFEEFFIFWPERDHRLPLIDALADCYDDKSLAVRFIFALRKDYYSDLATFQDRLPHIFHNEFYLESVTRQEAQAAITGPVAELGYPVSYEPALLDVLLDDLVRGGMELPHLQIICTELYAALAEGETTITLSSYEELGRAEGVLSGYLNYVLDRLPAGGGPVAREVFKELVTSESTKRVLSYGTLAARIEAEEDELDDVLTRLVNARLLRRDEVSGEITYEMAHEYLIGEIEEWLDQKDLAFKQAEELLAREVANWRVHGSLIPRDRLELLHTYVERFRHLDNESRQCLLSSALKSGFAIDDWAKLAGNAGEQLLLVALDDSVEEVRLAVTRALGAVWGLAEVSWLGDRDSDIRYSAATALEERGDSHAVKPLVAALRDTDSNVRKAAASALGEISDPLAIAPLIAALHDEDWQVREAAAESLGKLGNHRAVEPLIILFQDKDSNVHGSAVEALVRLGKPAVERLILALRDEDRQVRLLASMALAAIGDTRAVEPLVTALQGNDDDVCRGAAEALVEIGGSQAVKLLIPVLQDKDSFVRLLVAEVLEQIGTRDTVNPFIAALRDQDSDVRTIAGRALGEFGDPLAVEPLIATLHDEDWQVREAAAEALGKLGDLRAVRPLVAALQDKAWGARDSVSKALAELGRPALEPLISALKDDNAYVRSLAAEALEQIGTRDTVNPFIAALQDQDSDVRAIAARALGEIGDPRAVEPLVAVLEDENRRVREAAAEALGKLGDPRAVRPLIAASRDTNSHVRRAVAQSLGEIGDPRAVEPLVALLQDQAKNQRRQYYVQEASAGALRKIATPKARHALKVWQQSRAGVKHPSVRFRPEVTE